MWILVDVDEGKDIGVNEKRRLLLDTEKLRTFIIRYDGEVRELSTKDFDFLKDVSQTSQIGYDNDERVLERNKLKIKLNVLFGHNFTQEEISQFESDFDNRTNKNEKIDGGRFFRKSNNERCRLYGQILHSIGNLPYINKLLSCTLGDKFKHTFYAITLCLFYQNDFNGQNKYARIQFTDRFNIAQYFPGYLRNKDMWDYCKKKKRIFTIDEFRLIVEGTFDYEFLKKQSNLGDYN